MTKELVISANRHETRVAVLEDDQLVEINFQRSNEYSLAGSIHKGRVTRVLPGMQSAFVDVGLERDTFLYVSDFLEEGEDYDMGDKPERPERSDRPERENGRGRHEDRGVRGPERPARIEQTPRPEAAPVAESETPIEAAGEGPAAEAAVAARTETREGRPDDRDRQGRRGRRRRNRGRGFPESKYATEVGSPAPFRPPASAPLPPASALEREPAPDSITAPSQTDDFMVLPGESLAKYRGSYIAPLDADEEDEIATVQAEADALTGNDRRGDVEEAAEKAELEAASPETAEETEDVPVPEGDAAEPAAEVPREAESESEASEDAEESEESEDDSEQSNEFATDVMLEHLASGADGEAEADSTEETEAADSEPLDTAGENSAQTGPDSAEPDDQRERMDQPAASASFRDRGGRYPHRVSRRMRRKIRQGRDMPAEAPAPAAEPAPPPPNRPEQRAVSRPEKAAAQTSITDMLKAGQEIIVQIAKEPLGQKGARITSHIALPGRYVVYMPTLEHMGVSRKIASDEERLRLKRILHAHHSGVPGGFIVRTAGEGKSEEELAADMNFLFNLWMDIRQKAEKKPAPALLHHDLDIVQRLLRDQLTENFKAIWVDNEDVYESVLNFVQRFQPALVSRVKLYTRPAPIFEAFNITAELEKALRPKVWLKSGGYIVINQTEALVAVDVNTGKYVGKSNRLEDTIVKTNTDAVKEIVRQIRLRDLGGIIVVDFIDMDERKNRQKVMQTLEDAMRADRAPYKILQFNDFGLVAITRKRVKQSLERTLCAPCPYCDGAGYVKSPQTTVSEILQEAHKIAKAVEGEEVILRVNPEVAKLLNSHTTRYLEELEGILRRPVLVKSDPLLHQEKFDLA